MNDNQARDLAEVAVLTLRRSERGRQALADFKSLLDSGGYGLDDENWQALTILCQLCTHGKDFAVAQQLDRREA